MLTKGRLLNVQGHRRVTISHTKKYNRFQLYGKNLEYKI